MAAGSTDFDRLGDLLQEVCGVAPSTERPPTTNGPRVDGGERDGGQPSGDEDLAADGLGVARVVARTWAGAVGEEVAANARPVYLRRGRLTVSTSSSAWAQTLQLMAETVKDRLNDRLRGSLAIEPVSYIVFRHAGWEKNGTPPGGPDRGGEQVGATGPARAPTLQEEAAIAEVQTLGLEGELEESILKAMRTSFGRP